MNSPKLWNKFLNEAPAESILMGGAIVDYIATQWLMTDGVAKDYDIFHPYRPGLPEVPHNWHYLPRDMNNEVKQHEDYHDKILGSVYDYVVDGEHKIQLIGIIGLKPIAYFKKFDHSLTLGRYSKNGMFVHRMVFDSLMSRSVRCLNIEAPEAKAKALKRASAKLERWDQHNWKMIGFE